MGDAAWVLTSVNAMKDGAGWIARSPFVVRPAQIANCVSARICVRVFQDIVERDASRLHVFKLAKMEGFVPPPILAHVPMAGLMQIALLLCASRHVVMVGTVPLQMNVLVQLIGLDLTVEHLHVGKCAQMEVYVWLQILVSVLQAGLAMIAACLFAAKVFSSQMIICQNG
jgi:hypothetical protein